MTSTFVNNMIIISLSVLFLQEAMAGAEQTALTKMDRKLSQHHSQVVALQTSLINKLPRLQLLKGEISKFRNSEKTLARQIELSANSLKKQGVDGKRIALFRGILIKKLSDLKRMLDSVEQSMKLRLTQLNSGTKQIEDKWENAAKKLNEQIDSVEEFLAPPTSADQISNLNIIKDTLISIIESLNSNLARVSFDIDKLNKQGMAPQATGRVKNQIKKSHEKLVQRARGIQKRIDRYMKTQ